MKTIIPGDAVYLCLVTWPDGTEGLLFPRPGNVPVAQTEADGFMDLQTAAAHLSDFLGRLAPGDVTFKTTKIRLIKFQCLEVLAEHVHGA